MGKIANISIEYYEDNFDIEKIYAAFLSQETIDYFDNNYFLVDYDPVEFELDSFNSIRDVLLKAIKTYKNDPLVFSIIFDEIITHHTLNADIHREINIAISAPRFLDGIKVPDFSYYLKKLLPHFNMFEIQRVEFSYG